MWVKEGDLLIDERKSFIPGKEVGIAYEHTALHMLISVRDLATDERRISSLVRNMVFTTQN